MDQYEACNKLADTVRSKIKIEWCNKEEFAKQYKKHTGLPIKEVFKTLTLINKSYGIVWYHRQGFIFKFTAKSKLGKLEIDWGTYYTLFNLRHPKDLITVSNKFKSTNTIHPNIYNKGGYDFYLDSTRICLPYEVNIQDIYSLIKTGNIHSWLDQVVSLVRANDGNGRIDRFKNICFKACTYCGDYINVGKETKCDTCLKNE